MPIIGLEVDVGDREVVLSLFAFADTVSVVVDILKQIII